MNRKFLQYLLASLLLFAGATPAFPQDRFHRMDIGVAGGVSFYMGDAFQSHRAQPAYGVQIRRAFNPRYAIRAHFYQGSVEGNTRDFDNRFPIEQEAKFRKNIWDFGLQLEFNFLNYGLPAHLHESSRISPYIFAGLGTIGYTDDGISGNSKVTVNFPFGVGIKFKVLPRVNLIAAWSMHKLFTDEFDIARNNNLLNDPYNFGNQGGGKNADWFSFGMLALSYDLFPEQYCR